MGQTLNIAFTNAQIENFYVNGMKLAIAKSNGRGDHVVVWQIFSPFSQNTLTWQDNYGIYASTSELVTNITLSPIAVTDIPAVSQKLYTLQTAGLIHGPGDAIGQSDQFAVLNQYLDQSAMTVGLYQNAIVNYNAVSGNIVSALSVPVQVTAFIAPPASVYLWIEAAQITNSTFVMTDPLRMTEIKLDGSVNEISVAYNDTLGRFTII